MSKDTKQLIRELVEEVIEEMTATGAIAGYQTPAAFGKNPNKKKNTERSIPGGKVVGDIDTDDTSVKEEIDGEDERLPIVSRGPVSEARSRYRNFKESDMMKNHAKVSYGINQAKKMLGEVEYLVGICERLKTESGIPNTKLWARTKPDMMEIHHRLKEIAKRINRMGK
jgi:hypothetical protein